MTRVLEGWNARDSHKNLDNCHVSSQTIQPWQEMEMLRSELGNLCNVISLHWIFDLYSYDETDVIFLSYIKCLLWKNSGIIHSPSRDLDQNGLELQSLSSIGKGHLVSLILSPLNGLHISRMVKKCDFSSNDCTDLSLKGIMVPCDS